MNALGNEEEDLIEAKSVVGLFDLSRNCVGASHQFQRHTLTELASPVVPKPLHVFEVLLRLEIRGGTYSYSSPRCFMSLWLFHSVADSLFSVGLPQRLTEVEFVAQHYGSAAVLGPEQGCLHGHGEAAVQRWMRILKRAGCDANLVDCHVRVYARSVVRIDSVRVRVEVVVREFPEFTFVAERLVLQCCEHYFNKFFEKPAVVFVDIAVFVPESNCGQVRANL